MISEIMAPSNPDAGRRRLAKRPERLESAYKPGEIARLFEQFEKLESAESGVPAQIEEVVRLVATVGNDRPPMGRALSMAELRRALPHRSASSLAVAIHRAREDQRPVVVDGVPYRVVPQPRARRGHAEVLIAPTVLHAAGAVAVALGVSGDRRTQSLVEVARALAMRPNELRKAIKGDLPAYVTIDGAAWSLSLDDDNFVVVRTPHELTRGLSTASDRERPQFERAMDEAATRTLYLDAGAQIVLGNDLPERIPELLHQYAVIAANSGSLRAKAELMRGFLFLETKNPRAAFAAFAKAESATSDPRSADSVDDLDPLKGATVEQLRRHALIGQVQSALSIPDLKNAKAAVARLRDLYPAPCWLRTGGDELTQAVIGRSEDPHRRGTVAEGRSENPSDEPEKKVEGEAKPLGPGQVPSDRPD